MNFKVNFTYANDEGKVLVDQAEVSVLDVKDKNQAESKIQEAMIRKFGSTGRLVINENKELTFDDILAEEDGVSEHKAGTVKTKPFFKDDDHLSFGSYTSSDFMDSKAFSKTLDSIR